MKTCFAEGFFLDCIYLIIQDVGLDQFINQKYWKMCLDIKPLILNRQKTAPVL